MSHHPAVACVAAVLMGVTVGPCGSQTARGPANAPVHLQCRETSLGRVPPGFQPDSLVTSTDGSHFAYVLCTADATAMVLDGVTGKSYEWAGLPIFSSDSRRFAYLAKRDGKTLVVVDGVEGPPCDEVKDFEFAAQGHQLAYVARHGDAWRVVVDEVEGLACDGVKDFGFAAQGQRLAYLARHGDACAWWWTAAGRDWETHGRPGSSSARTEAAGPAMPICRMAQRYS